MTRQIIENKKFKNIDISVITFWKGDKEGVQITIGDKYVHMNREDGILFFKTALNKLKKQVNEDLINPPWWQETNKMDGEIDGF